MNDLSITYSELQPEHFADVIALGNLVHGDGYLTAALIAKYHQQGIAKGINAGHVAYRGQEIVGFRLAFAAGQWQSDQWSSPELWPVAPEHMAYFKCNTIAPTLQGAGIGGKLLQLSIQALQAQGAKAGIAHLWMQSPGNAAVKYFSKHGGMLVKVHPDKWRADSLNGYECVICGYDCHCSAAEMVLEFTKKNQ